MAERKHFFDASRAILMFLGIPVHAAEMYRPGTTWLVRSPDGSDLLGLLGPFIHTFRVDAFFVIAGYFSVVLLERSSASAWYRGRLLRLGLPVLSCALLLNLPQELLRLHHAAPGAGWGSAAAQLAAEPHRAVLHLWFLVDLLVLSAAAALLWRLRQRRAVRAPSGWVADVVRERPWTAALVGLPALGLYRVAVEGTSVLLGPHRLAWGEAVDLHRALAHAPLFAFGAVLAARPEVLARVLRLRGWSATLALGLVVVTAFVPHHLGRAGAILRFLLAPAAAILMSHLLFALTNRLFARPSERVLWLARSSFTVYLVHHPIVVALGLALVGVSAPPVLEFSAIVAVTTVLAVGAHRLVSASPALSFLFNGVVERRPPLRRATLAGNS